MPRSLFCACIGGICTGIAHAPPQPLRSLQIWNDAPEIAGIYPTGYNRYTSPSIPISSFPSSAHSRRGSLSTGNAGLKISTKNVMK
jgi:hypothetical protein